MIYVLTSGGPADSTAVMSTFTCKILFSFALAFTTSIDRWTTPVGIVLFPAMVHVPWGNIAAASTLVTLPLVVLGAHPAVLDRARYRGGRIERAGQGFDG